MAPPDATWWDLGQKGLQKVSRSKAFQETPQVQNGNDKNDNDLEDDKKWEWWGKIDDSQNDDEMKK